MYPILPYSSEPSPDVLVARAAGQVVEDRAARESAKATACAACETGMASESRRVSEHASWV